MRVLVPFDGLRAHLERRRDAALVNGTVSPHKAACEGRIRQFELHTWSCAEERLDVEAAV
jgi:hypothetical protein